MSRTIFMLFALTALGFTAGCTHPANTLPPGKYESSSKSTDARGTTTTRKSNTYVYEDQYGNKKTTVETETTKDPKGLFNKETTKTVKTHN